MNMKLILVNKLIDIINSRSDTVKRSHLKAVIIKRNAGN